MTPDEMRQKASALRAKSAALWAESSRRSDNAPGSFVTGRSGRSRAMNKRTERALDFTIASAKKSVALDREATRLEAMAADIESGGPEKRQAARLKDKAEENAKRASLSLADRIFCGCYPTGWVWCDKKRERGGDWARLCYMSYGKLTPEWAEDCPPQLRAEIEPEIARLQALTGTSYNGHRLGPCEPGRHDVSLDWKDKSLNTWKCCICGQHGPLKTFLAA